MEPRRAVRVHVGQHHRDMYAPVLDGLLTILDTGGTPVRDRSGHVLFRTPMNDLAMRMRAVADQPDAAYRPDDADKSLLLEILSFWIGDDPDGIPPEAIVFRNLLVDYGDGA